MSVILVSPPPNRDPWLTRLAFILNSEVARREPLILGMRHDGTNLHVRFRAALSTPWVQVHVQSTAAGEGGGTYDASNYTTSTEVDCRDTRVKDVTVLAVYATRYYVWLVPIQYDGAVTPLKILYNGVGVNPDNMAFADIVA